MKKKTRIVRKYKPEPEETMYIKNIRKKSKAVVGIFVVIIIAILLFSSPLLAKIIAVLFGLYVIFDAILVSFRDDQGVE